MSGGEDKSLKAAMEALKKASRAAAQSDDRGAQDKGARSRGDSADQWRQPGFMGLFSKIAGVVDVFWNGWARPVTRFLSPVTRRIGRFYAWSFDRFAHVKEPDGARRFSRNRAAIIVVILAAITLAAPFILIRSVIPATSRAIYDAGMLATMREDHLYLGRAELIDPARQLYQVMGCRDISGCEGGDNTTYYRLRDNIILDIKYWTTRFEPYDPAEIAGAMVSELNDCTIRYYGRRSKALGWYPYIVSASCTPVLGPD